MAPTFLDGKSNNCCGPTLDATFAWQCSWQTERPAEEGMSRREDRLHTSREGRERRHKRLARVGVYKQRMHRLGVKIIRLEKGRVDRYCGLVSTRTLFD